MEEHELDLDLAEAVVKKALAKGADEADVALSRGVNSRVMLRMGNVELLTEAQPYSLSLRVYRNKQGSVVYTSDFTPDALDKLVDTALDLATVADPDPAAGLPDLADLAMKLDQINLENYDPIIGDLPTDIKVEAIKKGEEAAFSFDSRVNNTNGSSFSTFIAAFGLVNSLGFARSYRSSGCFVTVDAAVDDADGKKQRGGWLSYATHYNKLEKSDLIGKKAAERALGRIGARKVPTKAVPVIFDPDMSARLMATLIAVISGEAYERRSTFLLDKIGQNIGSNFLTLVDDPLKPGLTGSRPFDDEGVTSRKNEIFTQGIFNQFLFNTYTARKTGNKTTGSASRGMSSFPGVGISNFYLQNGTTDPQDMIAGVEEGLLLTETMGFGFNPVTGDLSRGAAGFWIEKGQIAFPVAEINIAGNLAKMLSNITQVGNDLSFNRGSLAAPTIRVENVMVSGL
jgi:PmbA protein